ncbi:baseplate assembly protein [Sphingobium limneticum]|uniref:Baseplate assembly protein n=1 Tax=Sphingobium limneticum TaxID=1007511 RepID=A0A5J5I7D6_9SPHN|nr:baseplate J/gp47 family protein [Sphingobium limneticum]KAA9020735.1 baseplate assembly protein [Sphingobium limneticum]KAA9033061.1 baseplate assembly protein [Sphingobium limneticum]
MSEATLTAVDLSRLPAPDIIEALDFETILADAVARMQALMPTFENRDSDPAAKLLQLFSYAAQLLRQRVNDAVRAVMPAYAVGGDLDNIAALFGIVRFTITPANDPLGIPAVMESDEDFRRRMVLAPEGFSVAGPEGAYISHALSASADVLDASATSSNPGEVMISVLSRTGSGAASPALIEAVRLFASDETRRPLTDKVVVQSAEIIEYAVSATITTFSGPDAMVVLESARAGLAQYVASSHKLGRDITRSGIFAALHVPGAQNVILASPADDIILSRTQAPYCIGMTVTLTGMSE